MLQCKNIIKDYVSGDETVHALRDVSLSFREHELNQTKSFLLKLFS